MKRETALRYAGEIARRVRAVNGLLATPGCDREAVRIKRVWLFGSAAKGAANPNDLDVLIDLEEVGRKRVPNKARNNKRREYANHELLYDGVMKKKRLVLQLLPMRKKLAERGA